MDADMNGQPDSLNLDTSDDFIEVDFVEAWNKEIDIHWGHMAALARAMHERLDASMTRKDG
jgi:hypothetical protein